MTLAELRQWARAHIDPLDADVLLRFVCRLSAAELFTHQDQVAAPEYEASFRALVDRRVKGEPVAYLTGEKEFWGLPFQVTPAVLIPRPETELLVERVVRAAEELVGRAQIVDIGTGSGAIILSVARELLRLRGPKWLGEQRLMATDVSDEALRVAKQNALNLGVLSFVTFYEADLLAGLPETQPELLVCNPPYVPDGEVLPRDVEAFEPAVALRGGADGMTVISRLVAAATPRIRAGSRLFFEIGAGQDDAIKSRVGAEIEVKFVKDLRGIERVVEMRKRMDF